MEIKTKDADEATFYWTQEGFELVSTEIRKTKWKNVVWFVFSVDMDEDEFNEIHAKYLNGRMLVEPKLYAQRRIDIKNIIRDNMMR